jgi:predicted HTH transcriptional regulator
MVILGRVESFKEGMSKIRNRGIADVLHHLDIMETWGSGYSRIRRSFAQGYPEPTWQEVGGSVKVLLPVHPHYAREILDEEGSARRVPPRVRRDRRDEIVAYLKPLQKDASVGEIAQAIGLKPRQTRTWLERMERDGTVTVRGGRAATDPNRRYRLAR